jgi:hypothetical protein
MKLLKRVSLVSGVVLGIASLPQAQALPFANGAFDASPDPWVGWDGELDDGFSPTAVSDPASETDFFSLPGGGLARLAFDPADSSTFQVLLSQSFTIGDPANPLEVTFDWDWNPSDDTQDDVGAILTDDTSTVELFQGLTFAQIAAGGTGRTVAIPGGTFAGSDLHLDFRILDIDFDTSDTLDFGNISVVEQVPAAVPAPGTTLLVGLGLLASGLARRTRRR